MVHGVKSQNFFPAVGANGPAIVHVNFGQAGFVFIEANVKKWGLAPMTGSLAPPPPYGAEQGSILLEAGRKDGFNTASRGHVYSYSAQPYDRHGHVDNNGRHRSRSGTFRVLPPTSPGPIRSPTEISLAHLVPADDAGETSASAAHPPAAAAHRQHVSTTGLGLHDAVHPPPEYTSPETSDAEDNEDDDGEHGRRRDSGESDNQPLIRLTRSRGSSAVTVINHPPIPTYRDVIRQGGGRDRSESARSPLSSR